MRRAPLAGALLLALAAFAAAFFSQPQPRPPLAEPRMPPQLPVAAPSPEARGDAGHGAGHGADHDADHDAGHDADHDAGPDAPEPPRAPRKRRGGMDVTFLVTADTHLGYTWGRIPVPDAPAGVGIEDVNARAITAMNTIAGTPYPRGVGGAVSEPRGVLVAGDLTEAGWPFEWARFEAMYGLTGKDGLLHYPVFEGAGNHDKSTGPFVEEQIKRRHGGARYAWDWDDLHLICLGEAPNDDDLAWLREDLARAGPEIGIVLYFHFPLAGAYSKGNWFGDGHYHDALAEALAGYRVLGIFNGHFHASGLYRWRGLDAYLVGSAKHSWHSFAVVRVTDDRMTVASYNYDRRAFWWWHRKPVFGAPGGESRWLAGDASLVGQ